MSRPVAIGVLRPERLTCAEAGYHLPGCYNPLLDATWCFCGAERWPGDTGTWQCVERFHLVHADIPRGIGMGALGHDQPVARLGWDTYWLDPTAGAAS